MLFTKEQSSVACIECRDLCATRVDLATLRSTTVTYHISSHRFQKGFYYFIPTLLEDRKANFRTSEVQFQTSLIIAVWLQQFLPFVSDLCLSQM